MSQRLTPARLAECLRALGGKATVRQISDNLRADARDVDRLLGATPATRVGASHGVRLLARVWRIT